MQFFDTLHLHFNARDNFNGTYSMAVKIFRGNWKSNWINRSLTSDDWQIYGFAGNDTLLGGSGNDQLFGGIGDDWLNGNAGNDRLMGGAGNDHLAGGDGDDSLYGGDGNDVLVSGMGFDELYGGDGADLLLGSSDWGYFDGGRGNDTVNAGDGWDIIVCDAGADIVNAGRGKDSIYVSGGSPTVSGGGDADGFIFQWRGSWFTTTITDFETGLDVITFMDANPFQVGYQQFAIVDRFTATRRSELVLRSSSNTLFQLTADGNGDGKTDFQILIHSAGGLNPAKDILL